MFNLLVSYDPKGWDLTPYQYDRSRVAIEYTTDEISERYKFLDDDAIKELMSFPAIFATEGESSASRIGYINKIKTKGKFVIIEYEFDPIIPPIPSGVIIGLTISLDIGRFEMNRTHWAIKDENLFEVLSKNAHITEKNIKDSYTLRKAKINSSETKQSTVHLNNQQVFIVHGHDEIAKLDMAKFIKKLGLEPVILHEQASSGKTIIEKIEAYSDVGFAVVLYTPCDIGSKKSEEPILKSRARQNVVFEHGYLIGKLGRPRVTALVKGKVEAPNDISGVVYINLDEKGDWKTELIKEMNNAGYNIDKNLVV